MKPSSIIFLTLGIAMIGVLVFAIARPSLQSGIRETGKDIQRGARDAYDGTRDAAEDVKDGVKDAAK